MTFSNIPILNIRMEYLQNLEYLEQGGFQQDIATPPHVIRSPYMIWLGMQEIFVTLLLQRSISGLEAYTKYAVYWELMGRGRHTAAAAKALASPTRLGKGGAADSLFNQLPAFLGKDAPMRRSAGKLWGKTKSFYEEVRNPLFHGYQLESASVPKAIDALRFLDDIYQWIDGWHDPEAANIGEWSALRPLPRQPRADGA
jgi:hypothetical protein